MATESGARSLHGVAGDLRSKPLAVLLAGARERNVSGTFTFRHGDRRESLTMRDGDIASVHTSTPGAYLGGILYELGSIDTRTLDETLLEVARSKRLHGEILVERGAITRTQLDDGLVEQTLRRVQELFALPEDTTWLFREGQDEPEARDAGRPEVDTWPAIWRGLKAQQPSPHVRRTLLKVEGDIHLRDLRTIQRFALAPEEMALCERLHAQASPLARLVSTSPLARERTELLVYLLALSGSVVRLDSRVIGPAELGIAGVRERSARIEKEDPFAILGLRRGASVEAARAAYFRLARVWHPDKLPAGFDDVRSNCQHIFVKLSEAHRIITDTGFRQRAVEATRAGGPCAANDSVPAQPVKQTMRDVDAALARNDIATAMTIARSLTRAGDDGPTARAVVAWCTAGAGAVVEHDVLEGALATLDRLLTGDPECARALFYRAQVAKRLGRTTSAARDFRKAARLEPTNRDAVREVRIHDMRTVGTQVPKGPPESRTGSLSSSSSRATVNRPPAKEESSSVRSGLRRLFARVAGK